MVHGILPVTVLKLTVASHDAGGIGAIQYIPFLILGEEHILQSEPDHASLHLQLQLFNIFVLSFLHS